MLFTYESDRSSAGLTAFADALIPHMCLANLDDDHPDSSRKLMAVADQCTAASGQADHD